MAKARPLANAPLREAVIDLRVVLRNGVQVDALADLGPGLSESYPTRNDQMSVTGELRIGGDEGLVTRKSEHARIGYMFRSVDGSQIVQFRTNGFTFSRLAPYTDWEQVFPEAMRLWARYVEIANPVDIVRIATRYVNDMRFPVPLELSEYLTAPPPQPPGIQGDVIGFLTQLTVRDMETGSKVNIIQTIGEQSSDQVGIILDVDAFQDGLTVAPDDSVELDRRFQMLRVLKNEVFFSSITEAAAGRFE